MSARLLTLVSTATLCLAAPSGARADSQPFAVIPAHHDDDLRLFRPDGAVVTGADALAAMPAASLVLWVAGNQFFAMERVIRDFQTSLPEGRVAVGVVTLPPGLELQAILAGGFTYDDASFAGRPDVYATVDVDSLRALRAATLATRYETYTHNELQIMVARGNPKHVASVDDLVRADVRTSMPNPIDEGIATSFARPMLEAHGLWDRISGGKTCKACQTTPNNWFTAVHHRETPARIAAGTSDAGIVWRTEVLNAIHEGAPVEGVALPPADSRRDDVSYFASALDRSPRAAMAQRYLAFLASNAAQSDYEAFGFVPATEAELRPRAIPQ